jgi:LysM repeat protein/ABC-type branched-subunit amino acid transport system substrate-binding protein
LKFLKTILFFVLSTLLFTLCSSSVYGQEKESTDIHKTRSSATINGLKYYLHTVEKGQTLFAIAKFYCCDVNDIVIDNPEAIDGIKPGQTLKILVDKKKPAALSVNDTSNYTLHKVEKGQTLYSITKQYGVSVEKLRVLNPELKDGLKVDQVLKIPSAKPKTETVVATNTTIEKLKETPVEKTQITEAADRSSLGYINYKGEKKEEYNIALFLPFHADEANALDVDKIIRGDIQLPNKTTVALQFYEGALLAIDSLKKSKLNAKIFVYDIDDKDSLNISNILNKPELAEMDLMIGPLYGSSFMPIASFAKEHNIAIVSPFTQINKILFNNPYVSKVSPSITLEVEQMAHFVVDSFQTQNIILVNNLNVKDPSYYLKELPFYNAFKNTANKSLLDKGGAFSDSVKEVVGLAAAAAVNGISAKLSSTKINVIVLTSNNQSYVTDFIGKLNMLKDKYKIVLFGLQNWMNYDNLDFEYLNSLSLHIPSNIFIDYSNSTTQNFVKKYRETYKTDPDTYVFQGFDVSYCFMSSLLENGSGFLQNLSQNNYKGIASNYNFSQFPDESGFENRFVYILKYQDYQLIKAN